MRVRSAAAKLALAVVATAVAGLALELASGLAYRAIRGEAFSKQRIRSRLTAAISPQPLDIEGVTIPGIVESKALHPYLGYVLDREPASGPINRFGFLGRN